MRYAWILLDADGTLFDYSHAERQALTATLEEVGSRLDPRAHAAYRSISKVLWERFERGEVTAERLRIERFEMLFERLGIEADPRASAVRYLDLLGRQARLLPDAERVVATLGETAGLLLATNGFSTVQRSRLGRSPLRDAFHDLVISEEVGVAKPHPGFFEEAFRRMGRPPREDVLMVGDSLSSDIAGGVAAGIDTCWLAPENGAPAPEEVPEEARPTYRITRLVELLEIVGS